MEFFFWFQDARIQCRIPMNSMELHPAENDKKCQDIQRIPQEIIYIYILEFHQSKKHTAYYKVYCKN